MIRGIVMQDDLIVRDSRQLRALGNPIRTRMLEHLCREPLTATQLGHLMEIAPARAHYHMKQLADCGLVELIEIRETAGIMEKFYRAVARRFHMDKTVAHDPAGHSMARNALVIEVRSAVDAFEQRLQATNGGPDDGTLPADVLGGVLNFTLTPVRYERLISRLRALLREFETASPGGVPYQLLLLMHHDGPPPDP